jgi:hypothetical protein
MRIHERFRLTDPDTMTIETTVTDPEAFRYFMSIPEAAGLVIQAVSRTGRPPRVVPIPAVNRQVARAISVGRLVSAATPLPTYVGDSEIAKPGVLMQASRQVPSVTPKLPSIVSERNRRRILMVDDEGGSHPAARGPDQVAGLLDGLGPVDL